MGAKDSFIAAQFQNHAFAMGLRGGFVGLALAALALFTLSRLASAIEIEILPALSFQPGTLLALALIPFGSAVIAFRTARLTVLGALRRLP